MGSSGGVELNKKQNVLKYTTVLFLFLFSSTPPDEPIREKQTVVGFLEIFFNF